MRGAHVSGGSVDPRHQLHGSRAQQTTNQQKQPTTVGGDVHVSSVEVARTIDSRTPARSPHLLHRQQYHQTRLDGE